MANQPKKYQKFVATAATATLVATAVVPAASADEVTFSDISSYATEVQAEVEFLADLGVINGFEDGTFKPAQNITRGQAVKMIGRFLVEQNITEVPENWETVQSFDDIALDRSDRDLVKYAAVVKAAGVFQGNGNVLNPSGFTTRENMALILDRLVGQVTGKTAVEWAAGKTNNVSDLANAKEEAREAIAALNALGVSNAEEFKPKNNTQRVHFASFLARMIELAEGVVTKVDSAKAIDEKTIEVTFKTGEETETVQFTLENALQNGANEVTVTHNGVEYKLNVNYSPEAVVDLAVQSIKAINASELEVVFNQAVSATALNSANYEIKINGETVKVADDTNKVGTEDALTLSEDKKSVIIRLAPGAEFQVGDKYVVQTNDAIKSEAGKAAAKFATGELVFSETAVPNLLSVTPTNKAVVLEFDRPVKSFNGNSLVKIDGYDIDGVSTDTNLVHATNQAGNYKYTVNVTDEDALKVIFETGTHDVVIYDVTDTADVNASKASVLNGSYTITGEVFAPVVEEVIAVNANRFFLRTNVDVNLSAAKLKVEKGNHEFQLTDSNFDLDVLGTNDTSVDAYVGKYLNKPGVWVVVTDDVDQNDENPLYKGTESTATLTVTLENFKDAETNSLLGQKSVTTVTLDKNNSKPVVESTKVTGKTLEVTFANDLSAISTFDASDVVVRDKDGVIITKVTSATIVDDTVKIDLGDSYNVAKEPYTVEFKAGELKYKEVTNSITNYLVNTVKNDALTTVVRSTSTNFLYTELKLNKVDEITAESPAGSVEVDAENDTIEIFYGQEMSDTARTLDNYKLDGKALPSGTTVDFVDGKDKVRLVLPKGSLGVTTTYKLAISQNVKTLEGSAIVGSLQTKEAAEITFTLKDNVAPYVTSAIYLRADEEVDNSTSTTYVEVTFSEAVKLADATKAKDDLKVVVAGSEIEVGSVIENVDAKGAPITTDNKLIVVLKTPVNVSQAATITAILEENQKDKAAGITDREDNILLAGSQAQAATSKYSVQYAASLNGGGNGGGNGNTEDAPVVKEDTVKENALATVYRADSSINGFIVRVTDAVPGLTYTVKQGDEVLTSAVATGETVTLSVSDQPGIVNEENELVATDVTVSSDRVAIVPGTEGTPTKVEVKVTDADTSFEELAAGFTASLDKAATAIYTVDDQEVSVELPADSANAVTEILKALAGKTPADLAGKTYTVTLVNPADKDKEDREETVYEISFPKAQAE